MNSGNLLDSSVSTIPLNSDQKPKNNTERNRDSNRDANRDYNRGKNKMEHTTPTKNKAEMNGRSS